MENVETVVEKAEEVVEAKEVSANDRRRGSRKTNDPAAPYGYKADGTPRKAPGRPKKAS